MKEVLFALLLALAWFGALNLALSAAAAGIGWSIGRGAAGARRWRSPSVLLALKLVPGAVALLFTCVVFLPAHWRFEPAGADESPGYTLIAFGTLGVVTLAMAARRAARDASLTRVLGRRWRALAGRPRMVARGRLPVYWLPGPVPVISLTGVRHPRIFLARPVVEAFTEDELDATLRHELAHHDARDNLKRVLVACSPDLLTLWPAGRELERRWREEVEFTADARAVDGDARRAVSLASALLKVARLSPAGPVPAACSPLYDGSLLEARVDRLLVPDGGRPQPPRPLAWFLSVGGMTLATSLLAAEGAWLGVHAATEGLIRLLP